MRYEIIGCDKCDVREDKRPVRTWTARRGTVRYTGDLCDKCWGELTNTFNLRPMTNARHAVNVVNVDEIPKA